MTYHGIPIEFITIVGTIAVIIFAYLAIKSKTDIPFSEQINHDQQQARVTKAHTQSTTRPKQKDPNTTLLRNIYWLTFFNTFFKKK